MNHDSLSSQNFSSSAFPPLAYAGLVGGEGLSEQMPKPVALSDSPSPPTSLNYCQNGLLNSATLGSVTDSYTYNSFGEVSNYTAAYPLGLSCQISYTRDAIGRITSKTEDINTVVTSWGYTYDLAGRLTQTTKNGDLWASYGYDSNGNRLTKTTSSQTINGTYDSQDRLLAYGNYTFTYTANGELETKTDTATSEMTTYTYDVLGNLKAVLMADGTSIEYVVDGRNRRVGKKVGGTLQRQWIYDGQLRPVAELDGAGALVSQFVYATHINVPDYMIKGGVTYRIITDHLGSLRFVIDTATGTIAQRIDYDDWGNVLVNTAPDFTPFGFAGGMYDSQTKLVRFGARDYDAATGRWTAKDPIGFGGGSGSLYCYAKNDPMNFYDPYGLFDWVEDILRPVSDFSAGFGDNISFGLTDIARDLIGGNEQVNKCSGWYSGGQWTGVAYSISMGVAGGLKAAGSKAAGKEFSHWIPARMGGPGSIWNGNYVSSARHYYHDPFRFPIGWRDLGPKWTPPVQQFDRIPNLLKGTAAGTAYGAGSMAANAKECGC